MWLKDKTAPGKQNYYTTLPAELHNAGNWERADCIKFFTSVSG